MFKEAIYPGAPNGILERVRLDELIIVPESTEDPEPWATHAPPDMQWDGKRGFKTTEYLPIFKEDLSVLNGYMPSCVHELSHQLGLIDLYQFNIELDNSNQYKPDIGHTNSRGGGMMNNCGPFYEDVHAYAMNNNLHKRRGYFGDYYYDLPKTCKIRLVDAYYNPVPNASIKFYQTKDRTISAPPTFTGTTDSQGYFTLPNRSCFGPITTATGHTLHDNPWGIINVVGRNGEFFCEINADGQTDYQYLEITPYNVAYNLGHKDSYTYNLQTSIASGGKITKNDLYGIKMVSEKLGYAVGDDGTILRWNGNKWSNVDISARVKLNAVDAAQMGKVACIVGDGGTVILYSDGKWVQLNVGTTENLNACAYAQSLTLLSSALSQKIFAGGNNGAFYRSNDGGRSWISVPLPNVNIRSIRFADIQKGIIVCEKGKAFYTTDGGTTWNQSKIDCGEQTISDCSFASETEAWACTEQGNVYRSNDGGATWILSMPFGGVIPWYCIDIKKGGYGWVLGRYHGYYNTTLTERMEAYKWFNQGISTHGNHDAIYDLSCLNDNEGWAVGKGGVILYLKGGRM
jgi:hypothetical protein